MTLPIDRTALIAATTNQVPNALIRSALNIAALTTPYDTIDELNAKTNSIQTQLINAIGQNNISEVVEARTSTPKSETFTSLKLRLDATEEDAFDLQADVALKAYQDDLDTTNVAVGLKAERTYVDTLVASVADGSPESFADLAAIEAAYPMGDTFVKLNLDDGYVYKWNGSAWVQGWVYQGIGLADKVVTAPKINSIPRSIIGKEQMAEAIINLFDKNTITQQKFIDNSGTISFSSIVSISDYIRVIEGMTYTVSKGFTTMGACYDDSKTYIVKIPSAPTETVDYSFTIPMGISWIRMNLLTSERNTVMLNNSTELSGTYLPFGKLALPWLKVEAAQLARGVVDIETINGIGVNLYNKSTITLNKYVNNSGVLTSLTGYSVSDYIPVIEGSTYTLSSTYSETGGYYDKDLVWIARIGTAGTTNETLPLTFTVPYGIRYVRVTARIVISVSFMCALGSSLPSAYESYGTSLPWIKTSKWCGKKVNAVGDSITEHNFRTAKNYQDYITDKIGWIVNNYGISGTGWRTPNTAGTQLPIYQRISSLDDTADLVTVFAGTNDYGETGVSFVLGSLGDTTGSTFYGALDVAMNALINRFPTKALAVFTPLPDGGMWGSKAYTMQQVADAIIQVANKYSVPVLDLFRVNNLNINNANAQDYFFKDPNGDISIHPNDAGHMRLADKILAFLNTL